MRARCMIGLVLGVLMLAGLAAHAEQDSVDLLAAVESGQVWARFWGAGPSAVQGVVERSAYGPSSVTVSPGTQFWAQYRGTQGMTTLGSVRIDLSDRRVAQVQIPTACTNLGLRTPAPVDTMILASCPNRAMARLAAAIDRLGPPHPAAQLAVWAVANDPPRVALAPFLHEVIGPPRPEAASELDRLLSAAAMLLEEAGLEPAAFRMFN